MGYLVENNVLITALEMELEKLKSNVDVLYKKKLKKCTIPPPETSDVDSPWAEIVLDDGQEFSTRLLVSPRNSNYWKSYSFLLRSQRRKTLLRS